MLCRVLLVGFVLGTHAYAPIEIMSHGTKGLAVLPESFPGNAWGSVAPLKLVIGNAVGPISPSRIPYFSARPDQTIRWDDMDWCLEAEAVQPGAMARVNKCTGGVAQKWNWIPNGQGSNMLQLHDTKMCLDVRDVSGLDGAPIELRDCENSVTETWKFEDPMPGIPASLARSSNMRHVMLSLLALAGIGVLSVSALRRRWQLKGHAAVLGHGGSALNIGQCGGVALTAPVRRADISMIAPSLSLANTASGQPTSVSLKSKRRCAVTAQLGAATEGLPDSFQDSVQLAVEACMKAIFLGNRQLIIEFDVSAGEETYSLCKRTSQFVQPFLPAYYAGRVAELAEDQATIQVLWPDEGAAGWSQAKWGGLPPGTVCDSLPGAELFFSTESAKNLVIVAPEAREVDTLEYVLRQVSEKAPDMPVIIFNPNLVNMDTTGFGFAGRQIRDKMNEEFEKAFVLKTLPGGAIFFRQYPGPWTVYREEEGPDGGWTLVYSSMTRPDDDEVIALAEGEDPFDESGESEGPGFLAGLAQFVRGFGAL